MKVVISTREEYEYAHSRGIEPLIEKKLPMDIRLRKEIQEELFGKGNHQSNNQKFYKWVWEHKKHRCEECNKPLPRYSATYVSHIVSRGENPFFAYDPRNTNILCKECHDRWELKTTRGTMRIINNNTCLMNKFKDEEIKYKKLYGE